MPRFSFQLRTDDIVAANPMTVQCCDLKQAIEVTLFCMVERAVLDIDATMMLAESVLEIVDEGGEVVASVPIADVITRH